MSYNPFASENLYGLGGWLIWFQFTLYASILNLFFFPTDVVLSVGFIALIVICLYFFYKRRVLFRYVYIAIIVLILILDTRWLPYSSTYMIAQAIEGGIVTIALFLSRRVRNTFD
jgi:hypothetical protein